MIQPDLETQPGCWNRIKEIEKKLKVKSHGETRSPGNAKKTHTDENDLPSSKLT